MASHVLVVSGMQLTAEPRDKNTRTKPHLLLIQIAKPELPPPRPNELPIRGAVAAVETN